MITRDASEFAAILGKKAALLALDAGEKTIGIAACDAMWISASPIETIRRTKFTADAARIRELGEERQVAGFVLGYPLNMNGTEGPRCQSTRQFASNLRKLFDLPVLLWDERMSTQAVTRTMLEADLSRARRGEIVDKLAATFILSSALDALHNVLPPSQS
jgi:putative Holliday junction resolvase